MLEVAQLDAIETFKVDNLSYFVINGPSLDGKIPDVKYAISVKDLGQFAARGQLAQVAQFYGLVGPGLVLTNHIFRGLNRYLYCDGKENGDELKYVFSRKPAWDYYWDRSLDGPVCELAPANSVFVTLISKNLNHKKQFPQIEGWIDRWNWVEEDKALNQAPDGWVDRYEEKVWSSGRHT